MNQFNVYEKQFMENILIQTNLSQNQVKSLQKTEDLLKDFLII